MRFVSSFPRLAGVALLAALPFGALAQLGVGTTAPNPKAALEIVASDKGLLIPRLDSAHRAQITAPPQGLIVYQTDGRAGIWYYQGGWQLLQPGAAPTAGNGLTKTGAGRLELGGALTQPTTIAADTLGLSITSRYTATEALDQANAQFDYNEYAYTSGAPAWQSFTAGHTGQLTRVTTRIIVSPSGATAPITLTVYAGQGTGGAVLATLT